MGFGGYDASKYPIFDDQALLKDIVDNKKDGFVQLCLENGLSSSIADKIIKYEYSELENNGLLGSYYLLYTVYSKCEVTYDDVDEVDSCDQTALKYILGLIQKPNDYIRELEKWFKESSCDNTEAVLSEMFSGRGSMHKLHLTIAQVKFNQVYQEIIQFFFTAKNIWDLVSKEKYDEVQAANGALKECLNRINIDSTIIDADILIKGNNNIGKDKEEFKLDKKQEIFFAGWKDIENTLYDNIASDLNGLVKYEFEIYKENGKGSVIDGSLAEYPVLSVYIDKRLILAQKIQSVKWWFTLISQIVHSEDFDGEVPLDDDTFLKLSEDSSDEEAFRTLMRLPSDIVSDCFEDLEMDAHVFLNNIHIYKKDEYRVDLIDIGDYDCIFTTFKNSKELGFIKYDAIRYGNVLKFLDRYLSDVKSGHLYDSLDSQNDVQYHMYTVLNILDKNITKQNVADIYENRYDFDDSSIDGLVTMRARVEGLPVEEE